MPWKNQLLYFALTATLASFRPCDGQAEAVVKWPALQARLGLSSVVSGAKHGSPTRHGSLAFRLDQQSFLNSTQGNDNLMTLKVRRVRDAHFLVDSGERPLTPLSRMPPKCGFSVKRTRRDVQFAASYQGCHVTQQDGDYVLPLRLWGAPMTMSCPAVLPSPSVFCFASGMVVKISGVTADELKVKVSSAWKSLSLACSSCGLDVKEFSGGLTLTVPYNRGLCVQFKDEEYLLSLLWLDVEILVTCPFLPDINPAVETVAPLSDSDQVLQHPQYHQLPMFPQYFQPMPTNTPDPSEDTVAPLPHPQFYSGAPADYTNENQDVPAAENREFPFMPQFHQYPFLPDPEPPTQSSAGENTADPLAQYPQMQQSPHYQYSDFPQFPMEPEIFHPTTPAPPLATSTESQLLTSHNLNNRCSAKMHFKTETKLALRMKVYLVKLEALQHYVNLYK
uniref:Zona pellucida sperm-binding protein 1/4 Ig-like domain-containing protein n=1 Tax=Stegastes partitus TaxID=144197 RepID=A0A3B5ADT2_9TELE